MLFGTCSITSLIFGMVVCKKLGSIKSASRLQQENKAIIPSKLITSESVGSGIVPGDMVEDYVRSQIFQVLVT